MIVGILLLDQNDNYIMETGKLPRRPAFDKKLLIKLANRQKATVSANTLKDLPPSLMTVLDMAPGQADIALSPDKIDEAAHLLIISRSMEIGEGKHFRFDNFEKAVKQGALELWIRRY